MRSTLRQSLPPYGMGAGAGVGVPWRWARRNVRRVFWIWQALSIMNTFDRPIKRYWRNRP
jgi:hypothetical protein